MALATGAGDTTEHVEVDLSALAGSGALANLPGAVAAPTRPAHSDTLQEEK